MTAAQREATDPAFSIWVSASAGSGKTKVLTERVIRLLLHGATPGRILCLTYTRAAAAEMRQRIRERLRRWAVMSEKDLIHELQALGDWPEHTAEQTHLLTMARQLFLKVLDAPSPLSIQTIHAFCQSILHRFPLEASLTPHFRLMEAHESRALQQETITRLFRQAARDEALKPALRQIAQHMHEPALEALLSGLISERRSMPENAAPPEAQEDSSEEVAQTRLNRLMGVTAEDTPESVIAAGCRDEAANLAALRKLATALEGTEKSTAMKKAAAMGPWLAAREKDRPVLFPVYCRAFLTDKHKPFALPRALPKEIHERAPELVAVYQTEQARLQALLEKQAAAALAPANRALLHVTQAFLELYANRKRQSGCMDYDDLILETHRLLKRSDQAAWVLYRLDGGIDHLLLDEAQDTSPQQWEILRLVCEEMMAGEGARDCHRTLFVVGDEKQSIYSFQGADPAAFVTMRDRLARRLSEVNRPFREVRLTISFRSTPPVLQLVDDVFTHSAAQEGIAFGVEQKRRMETRVPLGQSLPEERLHHEPFRHDAPGLVECWPVEQIESQPEEEDEEDGFGAMYEAQRRLAARITHTIRDWLARSERLPARDRPIEAGDVMILVRRRNSLVHLLVREMKRAQVPVAGFDRMPLLDQLAVQDALAALAFSILPLDDMNLACLLRSPLGGLSDAQLFALAHGRDEQSLWERLQASEDPAFAPVKEQLQEWLARAEESTPFHFLMHLLEAGGGRQALAARLGDETHEPLDELLQTAEKYEHMDTPSFQGFLHWLREAELEIVRETAAPGNHVRILTVHGAKGLQAPIVFLADTTSLPLLHKPGAPSLHCLEGLPLMGFGLPDLPKPRWLTRAEESRHSALRQEYMRLLYVAMTRAEDRLIVTGALGSRKIDPDSWHALIASSLVRLSATGEKEGIQRFG